MGEIGVNTEQVPATLDRIFGSSYDLNTIVRRLTRAISQILDTSNFYIATYHPVERAIRFEVNIRNGRHTPTVARPLSGGITEYVIRTRKALRLDRDIAAFCARNGIRPYGRMPRSFLAVPLVHRGQVEGVMAVQDYRRYGAYRESDERLLRRIAGRVAVVCANTRLIQIEKQRARELMLLNRISRRLGSSLDTDRICALVTRTIFDQFPNHKVSILLAQDDRLVLQTAARKYDRKAPAGFAMRLGHGMVGHAAQARTVLVANDVSKDKHYTSLWGSRTRSEMALPLCVGDRLIGVLDVQSRELNAFSPDIIRILGLIAHHTAIALYNASLYQQATERAREMTVSYRIAQQIVATLDYEQVLDLILKTIRGTFGYANCAILLIDEDQRHLYIGAANGYPRHIVRDIRLGIDPPQGITGRVAATGKMIYAPDIRRIRYYVRAIRSVRSEAAIPMRIRGELVGVLDIESERVNAFSPQDLRMFEMFASQAAIALENARLFNETRRLSLTDSLTRIANRRHFDLMMENEWRKARGYSRSLSVAMIDLDDFKHFNDRFGHPVGDKVLYGVARMLRDSVRDTDFVARYGGDEFAIILPETGNVAAMKVSERVLQRVNRARFRLTLNRTASVTISIGIATYPEDARDVPALLKRADRALYRAKKLGKNRLATA